jgi:hypothetical protein
MRITQNFRFCLSAGHLGLCGLLAVGLIGLALPGPALAQVCSPADFFLVNQAAVNAFPQGCTEVSGNLVLAVSGQTPTDITDLSPLSALTSVGGDLHIAFNPALTSLDGLSALISVGSLAISTTLSVVTQKGILL